MVTAEKSCDRQLLRSSYPTMSYQVIAGLGILAYCPAVIRPTGNEPGSVSGDGSLQQLRTVEAVAT
jgi:hypothetical protein